MLANRSVLIFPSTRRPDALTPAARDLLTAALAGAIALAPTINGRGTPTRRASQGADRGRS